MRIESSLYQLQLLNKPIALVVNKIDNDKERDGNFWNFLEFGAKDIFGNINCT